MLTIFACPKSFTDPHIATIQRNAITSWTLLRPRPEIILLGDEPGVAGICQEFGLRHLPDVKTNEYGTPLVSDLFEKAEQVATYDLLCYVNADIILMSDFIQAVDKISRNLRRFLMVGQRWDLDISGPIDFSASNWDTALVHDLRRRGQLHPAWGVDYFVYPRGLWGAVPPFALGRTAWDNWMLFQARRLGACLIDATASVVAIHQNHSYNHHPAGLRGVRHGPEAVVNRELAGFFARLCTTEICTHYLCNGRLRRNIIGSLWIPLVVRMLREQFSAVKSYIRDKYKVIRRMSKRESRG